MSSTIEAKTLQNSTFPKSELCLPKRGAIVPVNLCTRFLKTIPTKEVSPDLLVLAGDADPEFVLQIDEPEFMIQEHVLHDASVLAVTLQFGAYQLNWLLNPGELDVRRLLERWSRDQCVAFALNLGEARIFIKLPLKSIPALEDASRYETKDPDCINYLIAAGLLMRAPRQMNLAKSIIPSIPELKGFETYFVHTGVGKHSLAQRAKHLRKLAKSQRRK